MEPTRAAWSKATASGGRARWSCCLSSQLAVASSKCTPSAGAEGARHAGNTPDNWASWQPGIKKPAISLGHGWRRHDGGSRHLGRPVLASWSRSDESQGHRLHPQRHPGEWSGRVCDTDRFWHQPTRGRSDLHPRGLAGHRWATRIQRLLHVELDGHTAGKLDRQADQLQVHAHRGAHAVPHDAGDSHNQGDVAGAQRRYVRGSRGFLFVW